MIHDSTVQCHSCNVGDVGNELGWLGTVNFGSNRLLLVFGASWRKLEACKYMHIQVSINSTGHVCTCVHCIYVSPENFNASLLLTKLKDLDDTT